MAIKYIPDNRVHPFYLALEADVKASASPAYIDSATWLEIGKTIYLTDSQSWYIVTAISGSVTSIAKFKNPPV